MLRCRDACVRCASGTRATIGRNGRNLASGIATRTTPVRSRGNGLRVQDTVSPGALAAWVQRGAFSTTIAKHVAEQDIEELRKQIARKERDEGGWLGQDKKKDDGTLEKGQNPKPAMSNTALNLEMRWLQDPKALANRVQNLLIKEGAVDKAATLVRHAQKEGLKCIVAWNHIMDYEMKQGRTESAFKFYNDMKKRGRRPDAHTYTIMLKGLASNAKFSKSAPLAVSLYDSLSSPSSNVKPSTIHGNAALNVCSRHGDMDALWEIAGKLPESGYGAPDATTYTTILHALRVTTRAEVSKLDPESQQDGILEGKAAAIREAKRIWSEVVKQWHDGVFMIDQQLVSAMGQMLVFGGRECDAQDVFSLLHQTMGINVVRPRREEESKSKREQLSAAEKRTADEPQTEELADIVKEPGVSDETLSEVTEETKPSDEEEFRDLFQWVPLHRIRRNFALKAGVKSLPELEFPQPTNSELSIVLQACRLMQHGVSTARNYWRRLTSETEKYKISPDMFSYAEYLRVLRIGRASAESLQTLEAMIKEFPQPPSKNFIIAISACLRDRLNPNVLNNATAIIELMGSTIPAPDPKTLERYAALVPSVAGLMPRTPPEKIRLDGFDTRNKPIEEVKHEIYSRALRCIRPQMMRLNDAIENGDIGRERAEKARQLLPEEINGEPRRFRVYYSHEQMYSISIHDSISFLSKARALYNEILRDDYRQFLSESDIQMYRSDSAALDKLLSSIKQRGISDMTVFALDKRREEEILQRNEANKNKYVRNKARQRRKSYKGMRLRKIYM